jgi:hypothetical protein
MAEASTSMRACSTIAHHQQCLPSIIRTTKSYHQTLAIIIVTTKSDHRCLPVMIMTAKRYHHCLPSSITINGTHVVLGWFMDMLW